jgi:hypothetical protein
MKTITGLKMTDLAEKEATLESVVGKKKTVFTEDLLQMSIDTLQVIHKTKSKSTNLCRFVHGITSINDWISTSLETNGALGRRRDLIKKSIV